MSGQHGGRKNRAGNLVSSVPALFFCCSKGGARAKRKQGERAFLCPVEKRLILSGAV